MGSVGGRYNGIKPRNEEKAPGNIAGRYGFSIACRVGNRVMGVTAMDG
jgi:hypothetical protein